MSRELDRDEHAWCDWIAQLEAKGIGFKTGEMREQTASLAGFKAGAAAQRERVRQLVEQIEVECEMAWGGWTPEQPVPLLSAETLRELLRRLEEK